MKCPVCDHRVVRFFDFLKRRIPASAACARCQAQLIRPRWFFLTSRLGFLVYVLVLTAGVVVLRAWLMPHPNAGQYALNAALATLSAGVAFFAACVLGSLVIWARTRFRLLGASAEKFWRPLGFGIARWASCILLACSVFYGLLVLYHRYDDAELDPGPKYGWRKAHRASVRLLTQITPFSPSWDSRPAPAKTRTRSVGKCSTAWRPTEMQGVA